jgi:hypothetical protein
MNIEIGNYETKNFDIFPLAAAAFGEFSSNDKHVAAVVENAAKHVDSALGVIKHAGAEGVLAPHDFDRVLEDIDTAEELLDSVDELENHYYLRDELEAMAVEMYDISGIDADDEAESYADEEESLFGEGDVEPTAEAG